MYKIVFGILAVLLLGAASFVYMSQKPENISTLKVASVRIGSEVVSVEVADTDEARSVGLSGRASLKDGSGMLFVFEQEGFSGIWMKDMLFSIDIVFIDAGGRVLSVEENVSPSTYLQTPPAVFSPPTPAKYVLELPQLYARAHGIVTGTKVMVQY